MLPKIIKRTAHQGKALEGGGEVISV